MSIFDRSTRIGGSPFARTVDGDVPRGRIQKFVDPNAVVATARPARLFPAVPLPQQNAHQVNLLNQRYPITSPDAALGDTLDTPYGDIAGLFSGGANG